MSLSTRLIDFLLVPVLSDFWDEDLLLELLLLEVLLLEVLPFAVLSVLVRPLDEAPRVELPERLLLPLEVVRGLGRGFGLLVVVFLAAILLQYYRLLPDLGLNTAFLYCKAVNIVFALLSGKNGKKGSPFEVRSVRNFREELANVRCWDHTTEALWQQTGVPKDDTVLQNREELIKYCEFIEANNIRSYLEIGAWTGRLVCLLHELFQFEKVACCDIGMAAYLGLPFKLPPGTDWYKESSHTEKFKKWREQLGHIDLVMIDGDHSYTGCKLDYEINRHFPHRFLAFHDIVNPHPQIQVDDVWNELEGHKVSFVEPHKEIEQDHSTMGIGIWSATEKPLTRES